MAGCRRYWGLIRQKYVDSVLCQVYKARVQYSLYENEKKAKMGLEQKSEYQQNHGTGLEYDL